MASVEKRTRDGRTSYLVRWRDDAGAQRKKSFPRKVDADRYRTEVEHTLNVGGYVDPKLGKTTFKAYAEDWRKIQTHRYNTEARIASQLAKHVYPVFGDRAIATVRRSDVQALVAAMSTTLAPGSVRTIFSVVRAVFRAAIHDRVINRDPSERFKLPEVPRKQITPISVETVEAIADAIDPRYRALVVLAAGTGLRQGEVFGLQKGDLDFLRRTVKVERQVQIVRGVPTVTPPKNRAAFRTVPIGEAVKVELSRHLKAYPVAAGGFVFTTANGGALNRTSFGAYVWRPAVAAAKVPGVGMHDLRHFFASVLIGAGQSVKVVSERLGHSNAAMTLNVYSHLWPADEDQTRNAVDAAFGHVPQTRPAKEA